MSIPVKEIAGTIGSFHSTLTVFLGRSEKFLIAAHTLIDEDKQGDNQKNQKPIFRPILWSNN